MSLILLMQTGVAREALRNREFMSRGLVHRFLWLLPGTDHIGDRSGDGPPVPEHLTCGWAGLIGDLLSWSPAEVAECGTTTHPIQLTDAACKRHMRYAATLEAASKTMDEADPRRTYRLKWAGQTARIAGVLHCAEQAKAGKAPHDSAITDEGMVLAIVLASVLLDQADQALGMLGQDLRLERAHRIMKRIRAHGEPIKSAALWAEKMRKVTSLFSAKAQFDEALDLLFKRGYVAWRADGKSEWLTLTPSALTTP